LPSALVNWPRRAGRAGIGISAARRQAGRRGGAAEIAAAFGSVGLTADLRVVSPRRSLADLAWLVLAAIPLQPFFNRLADDLADDVHQRLGTFVTRVLRRPTAASQPKPVLVL